MLQLDGWVVPVMVGYIEIESHCTINGQRFDYAVISRRHIKRAGKPDVVLAYQCA